MKKQTKNKIMVTMAIIILAISMLLGASGSRQLNKIKIANNQIEEPSVGEVLGEETSTTPVQTPEVGGDTTTEDTTQEETPTPKPEPTVEPSPTTTQTPVIEETSSPIIDGEETQTPDEKDLITGEEGEGEDEEQPTEDVPVIDESKGNEYISEDDLIYSNKYVVTLNTIERIAPKTTIEEFLNNITITEGNTVKILKGEEEITEGYK